MREAAFPARDFGEFYRRHRSWRRNFLSYRFSHSGPFTVENSTCPLWMLTLVTTLVMAVIGNNIALSLGMVGALSIVRFRTAIKDARDTAYIFGLSRQESAAAFPIL